MDFEKKKIQLETLGEYLEQVRESLDFSLETVADATGIKLQFLGFLESGNFKNLPPDVYVFGFLRQLSELYSVDGGILISQYKKEKSIQNQIDSRSKPSLGWMNRYLHGLVITPKLISISLGLLFVGITLGYIIWQVSSINRVPSLEIFEPQDRQVITDSFVNVRGKTDPGMSVRVNGQDIFVDNEGNFKTQLGLESGPKTLQITASNKFDKTATKELSIISQNQITASSTPVQLKLDFSGDGSLTYIIDGAVQQSLDFHSGDSKLLTGQSKILIGTTNAGATTATLNGNKIGALGRTGEKLSNVPFFAGATGPGQ